MIMEQALYARIKFNVNFLHYHYKDGFGNNKTLKK